MPILPCCISFMLGGWFGCFIMALLNVASENHDEPTFDEDLNNIYIGGNDGI